MMSEAKKKANKKYRQTTEVTNFIKIKVYKELGEKLRNYAKLHDISVSDFLTKILESYSKSHGE